MFVTELDREKKIQLKQRLLVKLDDEGVLNEVLYDKPEDDDLGLGVSMKELADADKLITDDKLYDEYKGINFTEEDFYE